MAFPSTRLQALISIAALLILSSCSPGDSAKDQKDADEIIVAAASDLIPAFEELGEMFERKTRTTVTFRFGSTGHLKEGV